MMGNRVYTYPGTRNDYLRQAALNTGLGGFLAVSLFLLALVVDRYLLGRQYIQAIQLLLLVLIVIIWGVLLVQMALSLARFRIDVGEGGLTIHRSGRSDYIPFTEIESVDTINRPMWWAMRTDLKPLSLTSRHMIRFLRKNKPYLTFAGGLEGEEQLMEILKKQCLESSSSF